MKRCYEILMTVGSVLVLLLLSFGLLELPKRYFAYSDERLNGVLSIGGYDIDNGVKSMSRKQILEVFEKDDVLMIEEEPFVLDRELTDRLITGSLREFLMMFFDENGEYYADALTKFSYINTGFYKSAVYDVLNVENDEIYSARLGVLVLNNYWNDFLHLHYMLIIFDYDTYDILGVNLFVDDMYEFGKFLNAEEIIMKNWKEYYGTDISGNDQLYDRFALQFEWNGITIFPLTYETMDKKVFREMVSSVEDDDYLYVDFTKTIQE